MSNLKPAATSAGTTAFCASLLVGPDTTRLWLDGNGKITAANGTLDAPKTNAFSLAHIEDCPGATAACKASCYVHGLRRHAPATYDLYRHNSAEIRIILDDKDMAAEWVYIMGDWIEANCPGGFRWHVSGDIFSFNYARWIGAVTLASPDVDHWIYTRSLDFVPILISRSTTEGGNLAINISADKDNWRAARAVAANYGLRLCYMTQDGSVPDGLPEGSVIFPDYALRGGTEAGRAWFAGLPAEQKAMVCPVDYHGKAENRRCGPCPKCLF